VDEKSTWIRKKRAGGQSSEGGEENVIGPKSGKGDDEFVRETGKVGRGGGIAFRTQGGRQGS